MTYIDLKDHSIYTCLQFLLFNFHLSMDMDGGVREKWVFWVYYQHIVVFGANVNICQSKQTYCGLHTEPSYGLYTHAELSCRLYTQNP